MCLSSPTALASAASGHIWGLARNGREPLEPAGESRAPIWTGMLSLCIFQALQEELGAGEAALSVEKRNALKRDKTIQGLTLALKTKESEVGGRGFAAHNAWRRAPQKTGRLRQSGRLRRSERERRWMSLAQT